MFQVAENRLDMQYESQHDGYVCAPTVLEESRDSRWIWGQRKKSDVIMKG